jgi:hypothetical protein
MLGATHVRRDYDPLQFFILVLIASAAPCIGPPTISNTLQLRKVKVRAIRMPAPHGRGAQTTKCGSRKRSYVVPPEVMCSGGASHAHKGNDGRTGGGCFVPPSVLHHNCSCIETGHGVACLQLGAVVQMVFQIPLVAVQHPNDNLQAHPHQR